MVYYWAQSQPFNNFKMLFFSSNSENNNFFWKFFARGASPSVPPSQILLHIHTSSVKMNQTIFGGVCSMFLNANLIPLHLLSLLYNLWLPLSCWTVYLFSCNPNRFLLSTTGGGARWLALQSLNYQVNVKRNKRSFFSKMNELK